jgi:aspartokinase-like uncharacterized kinase
VTINVVKIGGSLSQNPDALRVLCQKLRLLARDHRIVVVPGGGKFANCVREVDKQFSLSKMTAHHMAIFGMEQYGLLLADLMTPNSKIVNRLNEAKKAPTGVIVVFSPSKFITLVNKKKLPQSWTVTSDSIAAYIAKKLEAEKLLLIKDVDGIFTNDPKQNTQATLFEHLTTQELLNIKNTTCIDDYLPHLLKTLKMSCNLVNGFYPDRIETFLNKQKTIGTTISP